MIHIFYRHYNVGGNISRHDSEHDARGSQRPQWFDYENCFKSLLRSIENKDVKLNLVMDGNFEDNWIYKYKNYYHLHKIIAGSDTKSFHMTNNIIKNDNEIAEHDLIYLLENDYLHLENWVEEVNLLYATYGKIMGYISLYDHLDKYYYEMYKELQSKIIVTNSRHWRVVPNTCGSFITTKQLFDADYDINSSWDGDFLKFKWLSENRNRFVLTPMPGLSTHCVKFCESPTIDWETESKKEFKI